MPDKRLGDLSSGGHCTNQLGEMAIIRILTGTLEDLIPFGWKKWFISPQVFGE
jgi:hypothetical protein